MADAFTDALSQGGWFLFWGLILALIFAPLLIAHALYRQASAQSMQARALLKLANAQADLAHALAGPPGSKSAAESLAAIAGSLRDPFSEAASPMTSPLQPPPQPAVVDDEPPRSPSTNRRWNVALAIFAGVVVLFILLFFLRIR